MGGARRAGGRRPLFLLYDYTFLPPGCTTKEEGLEYAHGTGVVCTDEHLLHPDPYPSREEWCRARVAETERRLAELPDGLPLIPVTHWPLHRHPTEVLWYPEFAMWCGTVLTDDWHRRYPCTRPSTAICTSPDDLAGRRPLRGGLGGLPA